jgi:hypothetical protein
MEWRGIAVEKEVVRGSGGDQSRGTEAHANAEPSVRHASDEQFKEAQATTGKMHAGLFRRLAQ